jgi:hypothetical protein
MPGPGCQSGGAPPTQTTTPVPACNTDVPKITTTLNNLASDILGITAQKDAAITPADLLALQATLASDAQNDLGNFNGGHFFLDLSLSSVANDFGGSSTAAYIDFTNLFNPNKDGSRYPDPSRPPIQVTLITSTTTPRMAIRTSLSISTGTIHAITFLSGPSNTSESMSCMETWAFIVSIPLGETDDLNLVS